MCAQLLRLTDFFPGYLPQDSGLPSAFTTTAMTRGMFSGLNSKASYIVDL